MTNVLINAPKTARKGEVIELKALIMHTMETGFRPGTNGRIIPRNIIERFFSKLKQFRRVATRYDKLLVNFMGFVKLAAIAIWLK